MKKVTIDIKEKVFLDAPVTNALKNINFSVSEGEIVCVLGPSGCGKTTLLRILAGIDSEFVGSVLVDNKVPHALTSISSMVFQEPRLIPWFTVEENIEFALRNKSKKVYNEIKEIINLVGLNGFQGAIPAQLSGGMAQRVSIARALMFKPELLVLDEPFASLDQNTKQELQALVKKVCKKSKVGIIMVTHDIEEAIFMADRIIVLSDRPGKIIKEFKVPFSEKRSRENKLFMSLKRKISLFVKRRSY